MASPDLQREEWRRNVLPAALQREWNNPDGLYRIIMKCLQEGMAADAVEGARQLRSIDPDPGRGAAMVQAVLQQTLELDPNHELGLGWYLFEAWETGGEPAYLEALRQADALPASWRAKLWLARYALMRNDPPSALDYFRGALERAHPLSAEVLMQISGDLGTHGQLRALVELTLPFFRAADHGVMVGNNLLRACVELGRVAEARRIVEALTELKRPDWQETLDYWRREIDGRTPPAPGASPTAGGAADRVPHPLVLPMAGPVWARHPLFAALLSPKPPTAPRVGIVAPSLIRAGDGLAANAGEDKDGMLTRALVLYLAEQIHLRTAAEGLALFARLSDRPGFILAGFPFPKDDSLQMGRASTPACQLVINSHIDASLPEWKLTLTALTPAGEEAEKLEAAFRPEDLGNSVSRLCDHLCRMTRELTGAAVERPPPWYRFPSPGQWLPLLHARCQTLMILADATEKAGKDGLFWDRHILDTLLNLSLEYREEAIPRLLLIAALSRHADSGSSLYGDYGDRVRQLQVAHPFPGLLEGPVKQAVDGLYLPGFKSGPAL